MSFTIQPPGGGGSTCLPQSDEFDGTALDSKWTVLRPAGGGPAVADGSVGLPILQGDFIANDALASNTLLQDAPSGEWTVTTRLDTSAIDANGEQAGLVIWKSESPNTFSKIVAIQSGAGNHQFEHIVTQSGGVDPPIPSSITPAPGGQLPAQVLLRARYDGTKVIGEFSPDDGADLDADRLGGPCGAAHRPAAGRPRRLPRLQRRRHGDLRLVPRPRGLGGRRPVRLRRHVPDEVGLVRRHAQHPAVELPASDDAGDR